MDSISWRNSGEMPEVSDEWMKPYNEFNQAACILIALLEKPISRY